MKSDRDELTTKLMVRPLIQSSGMSTVVSYLILDNYY